MRLLFSGMRQYGRMAAPSRVRFGIFEFDLATRELRRHGIPVRLQAQPAQVLATLLERRDEVVTRQTLCQAVWGGQTFVEFDGSLNFCIAQIRAALGDSAESPCFVRTLPRRGYQFIAPVSPVDVPTPPRRREWIWPVLAAACLIFALTLLGQRWWTSHAAVRIAVTRFDNETGNPALDRFADGLTDSVVADLTVAGEGRYGVIGNAAILRLPRASRDLPSIGSTLRAGYVVIGQVQGDAAHPRILAHLIRLPEQTHLWVTRRDNLSLADAARAQAETAQRIAAEFARHLNSHTPLPN
jgi:DNA-binding winged helix-turn-helix (wHTH) protein/TolB-like protein